MSRLADIEEVVARGGDADDVLRGVVSELAAWPGVTWAAILFAEGGELVPGPSAGAADAARPVEVPIVYEGGTVGRLAVTGTVHRPLLEQVAELVAAHVLLGWDTGGEAWEP